MSSSYFNDVSELFRFALQRLVEFAQVGNEDAIDFASDCDVHCGGERVVRTLRFIDVIIRVNWGFRAEFSTQYLNRSVADNL